MQINTLLNSLAAKGVLSEEHLLALESEIKEVNQPIVPYLIDQYHLDGKEIAVAFAESYGLNYIEIQSIPLTQFTDLNISIPAQRTILPLKLENNDLYIAVADPTDINYISELHFQHSYHITPLVAEYLPLTTIINRQLTEKFSKDLTVVSAVSFMDQILSDAIHRNASDIHFEPYDGCYRIRFRIDGMLQLIVECPSLLANNFSSRLKILAQLDIAEKRLPQDGRFTHHTWNGRTRDCRLSTCPTLFGEKLVIRILENNQHLRYIHDLGMNEKQCLAFKASLEQPQGLVLVTGPTGCGKTITLYAALKYLHSDTKNIVSIEDPIEIQLDGINQIPINKKINFDFAEALRAILRQDPDIIMIGEIRDLETANMAIRAAQTGHLVLATLHTNNASEAFIRLMNMGIPPFMLAHSILLIIAQRLIRTICQHCKKIKIGHCHFCREGYKGRIGVFELLPIPASTREHLINNQPLSLLETIKKELLHDLWQSGIEKVEQGMTDLAEILRVIGEPSR